MGAVAKTIMVVALAVVPGGFVALFAYVAGRAFLQSWQRAVSAPNRKPGALLTAFSTVRVGDLAREARAVLAM
jgi:hypothetical protein